MRAGQVHRGGIHCNLDCRWIGGCSRVQEVTRPCHTAPTLPHCRLHRQAPRLRPSPAMNFSLAVGVPSRITRCMRDQGPCRGSEEWRAACLGAAHGSCGEPSMQTRDHHTQTQPAPQSGYAKELRCMAARRPHPPCWGPPGSATAPSTTRCARTGCRSTRAQSRAAAAAEGGAGRPGFWWAVTARRTCGCVACTCACTWLAGSSEAAYAPPLHSTPSGMP